MTRRLQWGEIGTTRSSRAKPRTSTEGAVISPRRDDDRAYVVTSADTGETVGTIHGDSRRGWEALDADGAPVIGPTKLSRAAVADHLVRWHRSLVRTARLKLTAAEFGAVRNLGAMQAERVARTEALSLILDMRDGNATIESVIEILSEPLDH